MEIIIKTSSFDWVEFLGIIGTFFLGSIAIYPLIKSNWRKCWIKISQTLVSPHSSSISEEKTIEPRSLILSITNKTDIDIGLQMVNLYFYKKREKLFSKRLILCVCFGSRKRFPEKFAKRFESNEYFFLINNTCVTIGIDELVNNGIPNEKKYKKNTSSIAYDC